MSVDGLMALDEDELVSNTWQRKFVAENYEQFFPIKIKCQGIPCLCSCRPFYPALKNNEMFSRTKFQTCICSIVIEGQIAKYSNFYKRPSAVGKGTLKFRSFLMHFLGHFFLFRYF